MELTIGEVLQQGMTAHKEGKLHDAERLYRAILQSRPLHPDANHNLGLIAVSLNKADAALPLFKIALDADPEVEQYWLSYIGALIKEQQFEDAEQLLEQGKKQGIDGEKLDLFKAQIVPVDQKESATSERPSQQQLGKLIEHYEKGEYVDAGKLAVSITQEFPSFQFGWKFLGTVFKKAGRIRESLTAIRKSVQLDPQDAEAHYNLGNTLKELGRLDEAEASYIQAIKINPNFAKAHNNLGSTLQGLGRLDEAEASYTQTITLKPDYVEAHENLGDLLQEMGRLNEAEASYAQAKGLKPN